MQKKFNEKVTPETVNFEKIYLYTNLDWAERHPKNRELDEKLVKKYKNSMLNGASDELIGLMVIDINTNYIYDGQHRIEAYKQAVLDGFDRPLRVMFIDAPKDEEKQIELITSLNDGKHWNNYDFIHSYKEGDNDLKKLEEFCLSHPRLYREVKTGKKKGTRTPFYRRAAAVVTGEPTYYKKALINGTFKVDEDAWKEAETTYNEAMKFLENTGLNKQSDIPAIESIFNAWYAIRNDYNSRRKIEKLPNGVDDIFDSCYNMDITHTTKVEVWKDRFKNAINEAYSENIKRIKK